MALKLNYIIILLFSPPYERTSKARHKHKMEKSSNYIVCVMLFNMFIKYIHLWMLCCYVSHMLQF